MQSTLLLRTLLTACVLSGTMIYACGSDEPETSEKKNSSDKDDDDENEEASSKRDGGSNKKDGSADDEEEDDGEEEGCTSIGEPCMCDDGATGFATCTGGELSECMCISRTGEAGPPIEECPGELTCGKPAIGNQTICLEAGGMPPDCPESKDCSEIDLPGATCLSIASFSLCTQPCIAESTGEAEGDAGADEVEEDAGDEEGDAGAGDEEEEEGSADAGAADAGRSRR